LRLAFNDLDAGERKYYNKLSVGWLQTGKKLELYGDTITYCHGARLTRLESFRNQRLLTMTVVSVACPASTGMPTDIETLPDDWYVGASPAAATGLAAVAVGVW
jgi:hypothetical protein